MLAFEGSPIRKLAPELDAAKVEEHKKLLNDSQYKHLCALPSTALAGTFKYTMAHPAKLYFRVHSSILSMDR